ncbi:MAG: histidinol-phosphatase HisJ family protein [Oscillospiraceae bacterium]
MLPLVDCHNHSNHSFDAVDSMMDMCRQADKLHLTAFAITDHCDLTGNNTEERSGVIRASVAEMQNVRKKLSSDCEFLTGVELGEPLTDPIGADIILRLCSYDVVIGSIHSNKYGDDYYHLNPAHMTNEEIKQSLREYFEKLIAVARWAKIDVLAHITYPLRYLVGEHGVFVDLNDYRQEIDELFHTLIKNEIALEVNSSGLRQKIGEPIPNKALLKRYHELGGTLVSLGSDSHCVKDLSAGISTCTRMLKDLGFPYVTYFKERKPVHLPL